MRVLGKLVVAGFVAAAIAAGCKTSTAGGPAAGAADGGAVSGIESAASGAGVAAAGAVADAGAAAANASQEAAASTATTAAEAAQRAASMASGAGTAAAAAATEAAKPAAPAPAPPANDGQIAAIAHAANQGDILKSQLAKRRSRNAKVKAFANLMIRDHGALDARGDKLGIAPEENDTSRALTQGAQDALTTLTPLKGKEFDTAYVENEVASHEKVLKALDDALIPNAKAPKLKALLQVARAKVKMHLEHAQELAATLSR